MFVFRSRVDCSSEDQSSRTRDRIEREEVDLRDESFISGLLLCLNSESGSLQDALAAIKSNPPVQLACTKSLKVRFSVIALHRICIYLLISDRVVDLSQVSVIVANIAMLLGPVSRNDLSSPISAPFWTVMSLRRAWGFQ